MSDELATLDATAQAELIRKREASPLELVDAAIARIESVNPKLNAVITPLFEKAREQAASKDLPDGPFRGVPFLMKDLDVATAGDPFHCGMKVLRDAGFVAERGGFLADKLRAAGFVNLGKTNTPELGLTITTEPDAYGPSRNPWNLEHSTGGSSGGSAAAVAAGLVPAAHASDGGGSIRIPASECGLVGLKPSRGRISLGPDYGEYWRGCVISHVVTRSVRDTAAILDADSGMMPGDPYTAPSPKRSFASEVGADPGKLRIGFMARTPEGFPDLHPDCRGAVETTVKLLADLGHRVDDDFPSVMSTAEPALSIFSTLVSVWVAAALDEWGVKLGRPLREGDVERATWNLAETGRAVAAADYVNKMKELDVYTRDVASWWDGGFDVLVTPTLGAPPPRLGELKGTPEDPDAGTAKVLGLIPFTPPFNLTGQPAVSLPLCWNDAGLPVGVQLVAAYGREDVLIRLAAQLEKARPWHDRRPPIHA